MLITGHPLALGCVLWYVRPFLGAICSQTTDLIKDNKQLIVHTTLWTTYLDKIIYQKAPIKVIQFQRINGKREMRHLPRAATSHPPPVAADGDMAVGSSVRQHLLGVPWEQVASALHSSSSPSSLCQLSSPGPGKCPNAHSYTL